MSSLLTATVISVIGCQNSSPLGTPDPAEFKAVHPAGTGEIVPGQYIVVFRNHVGHRDVPGLAKQLVQEHQGRLGPVYSTAIKGFAARLTDNEADRLARHPLVAWIEADRIVHMAAVPTGVERIFATANPSIGIDGQDDARIDADVAVLDTGIAAHPDLNIVARTYCVSTIWDELFGIQVNCTDDEGDDGNGHGTHVAGTIGAIDGGGVVGVAPGVRLYSVKVLDDTGSGYLSGVVAGVDWATARGVDVANMSLSFSGSSAALDTAITNSVASGVTYAVAAGNSGTDASGYSPANHPDVITVSALADFDGLPGATGTQTCRADQDDTLADFSNYGSAVEIAAPGVCILSTWLSGGYNTISGTSMATPHVAGAAALLAASGYSDPATIRSTLMARGNHDWTDESGDGIHEPLLDVSDSAVFAPATGGDPLPSPDPDPDPEPEPSNTPPTVEISNPTSGETFPQEEDETQPNQIRVVASDTEDDPLGLSGALTVEVKVGDGDWLSTTFSGGFYRRDFDWTSLPNGPVTVYARATDSGALTTDAAPVDANVDNGTTDQPPTAAIVSPANGSTVTDNNVTIQVDATDAEDPTGSLAVEVQIGSAGAWQAAAWNSGTSRYELGWDTSGVTDGTSVAIDARATDSAANMAHAAGIEVTVDHPDDPPATEVTKIVIDVAQKGPSHQAQAEVHAEKGTAITARFYLEGVLLNEASNSVGGRGFAVLQSDKVKGLGGTDTFSIEIVSPSSGVTTCSVSLSQGSNTCP